ncbi:MAG: RNA pyrophosphohydrolase [Gammaproteobacteria bacterium]|nr:RNA pyrophosphohydrolase [Gammaproteobacteria bacterium]
MLDKDGYRPNVGIVLCNDSNQVLWARRCGQNGWQFPQGGIRSQEAPEQAMYRELYEEVGLQPNHVEVISRTREWLYYDLPSQYRRVTASGQDFKGQKQLWFLLRLIGSDQDVRLDCGSRPEFEDWRWVDYWQPVERVIEFKKEVYRKALSELEPFLTGC